MELNSTNVGVNAINIYSACDLPNRVKLLHLQKCHQKRQGRLCSLILIGPVSMEPISQPPVVASYNEVQIVVSQEPIESRPCLSKPTIISCRTTRFEASGDGCASFDRLLIKAEPCRLTRDRSRASDRNEVALHAATLLGLPATRARLQTCGEPLLVGTSSACQQQCVRQARVAVRQALFKPLPSRRIDGLHRDVEQLVGQRIPLPLSRSVSGEAVEVSLDLK